MQSNKSKGLLEFLLSKKTEINVSLASPKRVIRPVNHGVSAAIIDLYCVEKDKDFMRLVDNVHKEAVKSRLNKEVRSVHDKASELADQYISPYLEANRGIKLPGNFFSRNSYIWKSVINKIKNRGNPHLTVFGRAEVIETRAKKLAGAKVTRVIEEVKKQFRKIG